MITNSDEQKIQIDSEFSNPNKNLNENMISTEELIEVDGSFLEGGGQILRISINLSILFKKNLRIYNIRGKRPNPGLQRQHLEATSSICTITDAKLEGAKISSKEIKITPSVKEISNYKKVFKCDCNGAGSIGLLIQQTLPCLIFSKEPIEIEMIGGTIVSHAPPTYYLNDVLRLLLKTHMGIEFLLQVKRHGVYPVGGGQAIFSPSPLVAKTINPINITSRGKLNKVLFRICSTGNFSKINEEDMKKEILKEIKKSLTKYVKNCDENLKNTDFEINDLITIETDYVQLYKTKKAYTLFGQIICYFENTIISAEQLYSEKNENNSIVNFPEELIKKFENILQADQVCLDEFTVDHLIIFMALAKGRSSIQIGEISKHTLTALEVIKKFVPDIEIYIETKEDYNLIEIEGIGWT